MVAMVLLLIICLSSAYFFAIPPFRKEALRFAALERAAGMLDLMAVTHKTPYKTPYSASFNGFNDGFYKLSYGDSVTSLCSMDFYDSNDDMHLLEFLPFISNGRTNYMRSIWYTMRVASATNITPVVSSALEAELTLYEKQGDTNSLFATFKILLPPSG